MPGAALIVFLFVIQASGNLADTLPALDMSHLSSSSEVRKLVQTNIPDGLRAVLAKMDPESLDLFIRDTICCGADSVNCRLFIYITNGVSRGTLQLYRKIDSHWVMLSQEQRVRELFPMQFECLDIDCDGEDEILLRGLVGMSALEHVDVLKMGGDSLRLITEQLTGSDLEGRRVAFRKDAKGCGWLLEISLDGPTRFEVGEVKTYRLDVNSRTFRLVGDERESR